MRYYVSGLCVTLRKWYFFTLLPLQGEDSLTERELYFVLLKTGSLLDRGRRPVGRGAYRGDIHN